MARRPLLLMLTAGAAAIAAVANGMDAAASPEANAAAQPVSRLGASIGQDIQQRNAAAAQQSRELQLREQMVKATENRIQASLKAKQQQAAAAEAPQPQAQATPAAPSEMDSLATIYGAMKPAKAAAVFEQLDLDIQVMVAKRMRERSTAAILAAMSPAGAAKLSMAMAGRRPAAARPMPASARATGRALASAEARH